MNRVDFCGPLLPYGFTLANNGKKKKTRLKVPNDILQSTLDYIQGVEHKMILLNLSKGEIGYKKDIYIYKNT